MHLTILWNNGFIRLSNLDPSHTSNTSCNSETYKDSFIELANGHYLNNPFTSVILNFGSFDKNNIAHLNNCSWYILEFGTLCKGIITFLKNQTCSSLNGTANPLIIDA